MFKTMQCKIQNEINEADFVAVIADDTTDVSNHFQNVVVFRYIVSGKVVERLWSFCDMPQGDAETMSSNVLNCLNSIIPSSHDKQKLVAKCYDGASVMSGQQRGVQSIVKDAYPNAHYVHCYAHQLNLILQHAVSQITSIRVFFANLNAFSVLRLNALAMLFMEKNRIRDSANFNQTVIDVFAQLENRRAKFLFK